MTAQLSFDEPDLGARLDALTLDAIDALPFGVIGLDPMRQVRVFSRTEARQSGYERVSPLGLSFFRELAPCMDEPGLRAQLDAAGRDGTLDLEFEHVGDFGDASRVLRVRVVSAADGGTWHALQRLSG